jgi:histidyl-tRNA synthetase
LSDAAPKKEQRRKFQAIRGTRDLLPPDTALWNHVEETVHAVFGTFGFGEIRPPVFEPTDLFARAVGGETDIVSKEMYTFVDRFPPDIAALWAVIAGAAFVDSTESNEAFAEACSKLTKELRHSYENESIPRNSKNSKALQKIEGYERQKIREWAQRQFNVSENEFNGVRNFFYFYLSDIDAGESISLRPEATASVCRAYIEHNMQQLPQPQKLYYIGPMFRRERPQKGRYRQFYQIDAEVIGPPSSGSESPARDAEVLEMLATLLDRVGIANWTLELNSVGCPADRARFNEALRKALEPVVGKMCADCQRRAVTNPLRVFDCKVPADQPIIEKLPRISHFLDEPCRSHFDEVQAILKSTGVEFHINDRLVRGLDYYTRTAFEFTHGGLGAQNAILGGGRYDGLSEALGGPAAPGIGFAIGEDRLVLSLSASAESVIRKPDVYIAPLGAGMNREAARLARELRRHDLVVELGDETFRLKKSFEAADKIHSRFILIVGENEVKAGAFALKHLASGEQVTVPRAELAKRITQAR